jgi:hypothetical protein
MSNNQTGSDQIACAQAETKYKQCPNYAKSTLEAATATRQQNIEMYKQIFNKQLDLYQTLRNSNKTLNASVEPLQSYTKILNDQVNNSDMDLNSVRNQIVSFQNEIREYVPSKPISGPFNTKNADTGVQMGFYIFFFLFLMMAYLYVTIVIQQQVVSFVKLMISGLISFILVYVSYLAINKYLTNISFFPEKITSTVQSFVKKI